jgi:F-type H+-transporting ATPase subunit epsilon
VALEVHVVTPEREVWAGQATQVIAHGVDGDVGILTGHAPLLIQLAIGPLQVQQEDGAWLKAVVDGGFLHVSTEEGATRVDVLATNAQLETEIDVETVRRRLEELRSAGDGADDEQAATEIAKAEARISLTAAR